MTSERFLTWNEWKEAKANGTLQKHHIIPIETSLLTEKVSDTFGPNPCKRNVFYNTDTGEEWATLCDSPRCDDCGPRKAATLWAHITRRLGDMAHIATVPADDYKTTTAYIRQRRHRDGTDYQYAAMDLGSDTFLIVTDCPLSIGEHGSLAKIKKRFLDAYQTITRALRKSWDLGTVTLSLRGIGKSVTTAWKFMSYKARWHDREPWMDPTDAERHRIKREQWLNREATNEWYRQHHKGSTNQGPKNVDRSPQTLPTPWN